MLFRLRLFAIIGVCYIFFLYTPGHAFGDYRTNATVQTIIGTPKTTSGQPATNNPCPNSPYKDAYAADFANNTEFTPKNFGDPICDYSKDKLAALLKKADPKYWSRWFTVIVPKESSYDPNAEQLTDAIDGAHAWGLYQMGRGKNGTLDHGDVDWQKQTANAIGYNQYLDSSSGTCPDGVIGNPWTWCYWASASQWWRQPL